MRMKHAREAVPKPENRLRSDREPLQDVVRFLGP